MKSVGAYESKTHLPKLLEQVRKAERITITRHGVPVAVLQPAGFARTMDTKNVIMELRKFRDKQSLKGFSIKEIEGGRR
jgi:prevent-host-death family protein